MVLEKALESPLEIKKIKPVNPKGNQPRSEERRVGKECQTLFFLAPKSLQMVIAAMKLKEAYSLESKL